MSFKISHGIFKNYTGSSTIFSSSELVTTTISGPSDNLKRDDCYDSLTIETKVRLFPQCRPFDSMAVGIVNKILDTFVLKEVEKFRSISISVYTNTRNLSMICNSVLIACLDGGIPLKSMFYSVGSSDLFVFSSGKIVLYHCFGYIDDEMSNKRQKELAHIKECIDFAMADVFTIA
ncbi:uncharacterized protein VICG_01550 [Vittaforma corneae ATCC 50505]|uniref:Uncharacterized protein n=1 Tax=Vittaforma corneae (strain ATCC 50505) TaxID=993615 RepID=L2GLR5_VITCO|nr:uncharacterized protein VICG_01550 [Vittaforma corneae ATCC 50505]ELA41445.1 hypothetical protein VICG_01550 [Vittaforma corneae ATCC 50505]